MQEEQAGFGVLELLDSHSEGRSIICRTTACPEPLGRDDWVPGPGSGSREGQDGKPPAR